MDGDCRRLSHEDVARALRELDPAESLTGAADERWTVEPADGDLVLLRDPHGAAVASFAVADLLACRYAALTVLAARILLVPSVITAAVLGAGPSVRLLCGTLARHLPNLSQLAIHSVADAGLAAEFAAAGVDLSVAPSTADAVFGASLVVVMDALPPMPGVHASMGAVVVNASGRQLVHDLVNGVAEEYTEARLRQVLVGEHAGRTRRDDVLLVDLTGIAAQDVALALALHRAAAGLDLDRPTTASH
jgi:ornithine cyclodeaminase/alanine dehydrogenase-like protein (mu-crystallin family)